MRGPLGRYVVSIREQDDSPTTYIALVCNDCPDSPNLLSDPDFVYSFNYLDYKATEHDTQHHPH